MHRVLCLSVLVCSMACGSSVSAPGTNRSRIDDAPVLAEPDATAQANQSQFNGSVAGFSLVPKSTIFLQGIAHMGEEQPVLVLLQADVPNLCSYMQAGAMPKNATLFAAVIIQSQGGQFTLGNPGYTAPNHHERDNDPWSMAVFRKLDHSCQIEPNETGAELNTGRVVLRSLKDFEHVVADFAFSDEGDAVDGHIDAQYCDAPRFFDNLESFSTTVDPENCL